MPQVFVIAGPSYLCTMFYWAIFMTPRDITSEYIIILLNTTHTHSSVNVRISVLTDYLPENSWNAESDLVVAENAKLIQFQSI